MLYVCPTIEHCHWRKPRKVWQAGANSISRRQHLSWLFVFIFDVAKATSIYSLLVKTPIHPQPLTSNWFILRVRPANPSGFAFFNIIYQMQVMMPSSRLSASYELFLLGSASCFSLRGLPMPSSSQPSIASYPSISHIISSITSGPN